QNRSYEKDHYSGDDRIGIGDLGKEGDENVSPMLNKGVFGSKENDNSMRSDMNVEDENVGDTSRSHKESNCENNICNEEGIKENMPNKTYASAVHKNKQSIGTSLEFKRTVTGDEGCKFVIFDEELVSQAQACQTGRGRATFARVLVEFDVKKGFKDEIGIQYMGKDKIVKGTKVVKVEYQCKPENFQTTNGAAFNNKKEKDINNESNKENDGFVEEEDRLKEKEDQMDDIEDVMGSENMCAKKCSADENRRVETAVLH
nr:hypothetical protein [Tanacetum cinerariifolium]